MNNNQLDSSQSNGKLSNQELEIVNYLKLKPFDKSKSPPIVELVSPEEITGDLEIDRGVPFVRQLLEGLKAKGVVNSDRFGNWALSDRIKSQINVNRYESDTAELDLDTKNRITLIKRDGKTFAKVNDLSRHRLNDKIYGRRNIDKLLKQIEQSGWIKTLIIKPDGTIVSGNSQ